MFSRAVSSGSEVSACGITPMEWRTPSASCHHVVSADHRGSGSRRRQRGQHADQRGLARAVGPEQAEDLAVMHREADFVHGHEIPEVFVSLTTSIALVSRVFISIRLQPISLAKCIARQWTTCDRTLATNAATSSGLPAAAAAARSPSCRRTALRPGFGTDTLMANVLMSRLVRLTSRCVAKSLSTPLKNTVPSMTVSGGKLHLQLLAEADAIDVAFLDVGLHPQMIDVEHGNDRLARLHHFALARHAHRNDAVDRRVNFRVAEMHVGGGFVARAPAAAARASRPDRFAARPTACDWRVATATCASEARTWSSSAFTAASEARIAASAMIAVLRGRHAGVEQTLRRACKWLLVTPEIGLGLPSCERVDVNVASACCKEALV